MLLENDWVVQGDITAAKVAFFNMSVDVLAHDASVIKVMARREYDHKYRRGRWRSTPSGVLYRRMCPDLEVSRWRVFVTGPGLVRMADIINEGLRHDDSRVQPEDDEEHMIPSRPLSPGGALARSHSHTRGCSTEPAPTQHVRRYCYAEVMWFGLKPESNVVRVGTAANYVYEHIGHASTMAEHT